MVQGLLILLVPPTRSWNQALVPVILVVRNVATGVSTIRRIGVIIPVDFPSFHHRVKSVGRSYLITLSKLINGEPFAITTMIIMMNFTIYVNHFIKKLYLIKIDYKINNR